MGKPFILKSLLILLIWCTSTHVQGNSIEQGSHTLEQANTAFCLEKLKELSRQNDLVSQFYLGECYHYGLGVKKNEYDAFQLYRKTAERGLPDGMYRLYEFYAQGIVVSRDESKANEWFLRFKKKGGLMSLPSIIALFNESHQSNEEYVRQINNDILKLSENTSAVKQELANGKYTNGKEKESKSHREEVASIISNNAVYENGVSDIDENIPLPSRVYKNRYAVVIANENYNRVPNVPYALNDGYSMRRYLQNVLGYPEENIDFLQNATLNDMKFAFAKLATRCKAFNNELEVIIYFSGHGIPDENTRETYLLPSDGYSSDTQSAIRLKELYDQLDSMRAKSVIVILDACFSGAKRDGEMLMATRGVLIKPKDVVPQGNVMVLSATSNNQTAFPFQEQQHGLFTYLFLKELQHAESEMKWGDLMDRVVEKVKHKSLDLTGTLQSPQVMVSPRIGDSWREKPIK